MPFLHRAESAANTAAFLGPTYGALVGFSVLVIGVLLNRLERRTRTRHELRRRQVRVAHAIRIELIDILATRRSFLDVMESLEPEARITRKMLYNPDNFQEQRELPHRSQFMDQIEGFPLELASTIHAAYAEIRNANNFERFMSSYHKSNSVVTDEEQAEQIKSVQRTLQRCSRAVNDLDKWILSNHVE